MTEEMLFAAVEMAVALEDAIEKLKACRCRSCKKNVDLYEEKLKRWREIES